MRSSCPETRTQRRHNTMAKEERDFVNPKQLLRAISKAMPKGLAADLRDALIGLYAHSDGYIPQKLVDAGKFRFKGTVSYSQLDEFSGCGAGTSKQRMERLKQKGLVDWQRERYGVSFLVQLGHPNPVSIGEGIETLSEESSEGTDDSSQGTDESSEGTQDSSRGMELSSKGTAVPYSGLSGSSGGSSGSSGISQKASSAFAETDNSQTSGTASPNPAAAFQDICSDSNCEDGFCKGVGRCPFSCHKHGVADEQPHAVQPSPIPPPPPAPSPEELEAMLVHGRNCATLRRTGSHYWANGHCVICEVPEGLWEKSSAAREAVA
jgi:hypothetical protein